MQAQKYCKSCDKEILAISEENKNKVNHILHLLLTIVTVFIPIPFPGWWAIIWVILGFISIITPTWWRCSVCGGLAQLDKDTSKACSDFSEIFKKYLGMKKPCEERLTCKLKHDGEGYHDPDGKF